MPAVRTDAYGSRSNKVLLRDHGCSIRERGSRKPEDMEICVPSIIMSPVVAAPTAVLFQWWRTEWRACGAQSERNFGKARTRLRYSLPVESFHRPTRSG